MNKIFAAAHNLLSSWQNSASPAAAETPVTEPATPPASSTDMVDLSGHAQNLLQQADESKSLATDLSLSFQERLAKRMDAFTQKLSDYFKSNSMQNDVAITFQVDRNGTVHVHGPYEEKLEKYFKENPEAARELKTLAALNNMEAMHKAMKLYNEEKKRAVSKEERDHVSDLYALRTEHLRSLSSLMTFKDGELTSAAAEYAAHMDDRTPPAVEFSL